MIKAIIFDFFGVICSDEYWNFVKEDKNIGGKFSDLSDDLNAGQLSWKEFVGKVASQTQTDVNTIQKMYESEHINPKLVTYIHQLRKKYKTALLTNANYNQIQPMIEKSHLKNIFDEIIISSTLGFAKPDPRIFKHTLTKLKVEPQEAIFIDDLSKYTYVAGELGIHSIQYRDFPQMKKDLEEISSTVADK